MSEYRASKILRGKNFKIEPIEFLEEIQEELKGWIFNQSHYAAWAKDNDVWDRSGTYDMPLSELDKLDYTNKAVKKFGRPNRLTYWITKGLDTLPCHIDGTIDQIPIPRCRLLIPVFNFINSSTVFYENNMEFVTHFNQLDTKVVTYLRPSDPSRLIEIERVEADRPIWLRIDTPHAVINPNPNIRIAFTILYDHVIQKFHMP